MLCSPCAAVHPTRPLDLSLTHTHALPSTRRSKLFRFDSDLKEWKERGTGNVRFMKHKTTNKVRLLMRRERTLKICANHLVLPIMKLEANSGSDRSWVYTCPADLSEDTPTKELLAIRFANADDAKAFKAQFESAQKANEAILAAEGSK
jgi:Ran-binding protein 1